MNLKNKEIEQELNNLINESQEKIFAAKQKYKDEFYEGIKSYFSTQGYCVSVNEKNSYRIKVEKGDINLEFFTYVSEDFRIVIRYNGKQKEMVSIVSEFDEINSETIEEKKRLIKKLLEHKSVYVNYYLSIDDYIPDGIVRKRTVDSLLKELFES